MNYEIEEHRRKHVPLYNEQPFKLGLFCLNCSLGHVMSDVPTSFAMTWHDNLEAVRMADRMGFEVILPVARWRGFGGRLDYHGTSFETFTWASAVAASTSRIMPMATCHLPLVHPIIAAKMAATIDHVSNGRFGLNVVMGWFEPEMEMFGVDLKEHDNRYAYGAEWIEILLRLWQDTEPFDYKGKYFDLAGCRSFPHPVRTPPPLFNAGNSPAGIDFSARLMDFNLGSFQSFDQAASYSAHVRAVAREKYRRSIGLFTSCIVICRDSEEEAKREYQRILDHGDYDGAEEVIRIMKMQSQSFTEQTKQEFLQKFVAGFGSFPLVGTPEQVVHGFQQLNDIGFSGVLIGMIDYNTELSYFEDRVMPLLRQQGLRL